MRYCFFFLFLLPPKVPDVYFYPAPQAKKNWGGCVKKVLVIHFSTVRAAGETNLGVVFSEKGARYTHFYTACRIRKKIGVFCFCVKTVPVLHISTLSAVGKNKLRFFFCQKSASCTHFWNLIFSEKTNKKTISAGSLARFYPRPLSKFFLSQQPSLRSDYYSADLQITAPAFGRNLLHHCKESFLDNFLSPISSLLEPLLWSYGFERGVKRVTFLSSVNTTTCKILVLFLEIFDEG
jgi:hypothetical protein